MKTSHLGLSLTALTLTLFSAQQLPAVTVLTGNLGALTSTTTTTGTLANQGTALEEMFSLSSASNLTIYTTSYGGGMNADGSTAMPGGFMPSLVLYNSAGNYVAGETFPSPIGKMDATTGLVGDSYLSAKNMASGSYILALSDFQVQQSATATNLSDGFVNFGGGASFLDAQGNLRTGNYALSLSAIPVTTATPEPGTLFLVIPALLGVIILVQRRRVSAS